MYILAILWNLVQFFIKDVIKMGSAYAEIHFGYLNLDYSEIAAPADVFSLHKQISPL